MKNLQAITDQFAISLSLLCAVHCLGVPVLMVLVPSMASLSLDSEAFHVWMVVAVLPISMFAFTLGCKQHQRYRLLMLGGAGLSLMVMAVFLGEAVIGEVGEKLMTLVGAGLVAWGHVSNYRLCKTQTTCDCEEHSSVPH